MIISAYQYLSCSASYTLCSTLLLWTVYILGRETVSRMLYSLLPYKSLRSLFINIKIRCCIPRVYERCLLGCKGCMLNKYLPQDRIDLRLLHVACCISSFLYEKGRSTPRAYIPCDRRAKPLKRVIREASCHATLTR